MGGGIKGHVRIRKKGRSVSNEQTEKKQKQKSIFKLSSFLFFCGFGCIGKASHPGRRWRRMSVAVWGTVKQKHSGGKQFPSFTVYRVRRELMMKRVVVEFWRVEAERVVVCSPTERDRQSVI